MIVKNIGVKCVIRRRIRLSSRHRKAEVLISALLRSSVSRGSDSHLGCHSLPLPFESSVHMPNQTKKSTAYGNGLFCLAGAGGFEPATHGFGVALKVCEALILLAFSPVSAPFSRKTVCRSCV